VQFQLGKVLWPVSLSFPISVWEIFFTLVVVFPHKRLG